MKLAAKECLWASGGLVPAHISYIAHLVSIGYQRGDNFTLQDYARTDVWRPIVKEFAVRQLINSILIYRVTTFCQDLKFE